jgi:protein associated with RNAse G/E
MGSRIYYRKEKLRGASWEYEVDGGWLIVPVTGGCRHILHHQFTFYRPREVEVRTPDGIELMERAGADQWFFIDRWYSLLRFRTDDDRTVGYYVNFSLPLSELRENYYRDLDLELDLWIEPDGTTTELDRDEFDSEIERRRMRLDWADAVTASLRNVSEGVASSLAEFGPNLDIARNPDHGLPEFILRS